MVVGKLGCVSGNFGCYLQMSVVISHINQLQYYKAPKTTAIVRHNTPVIPVTIGLMIVFDIEVLARLKTLL